MSNYVVRCEWCGGSVRIGDIKRLERFKERHTTGECVPRKRAAEYSDHAAVCKALGAEMRRMQDEAFRKLLARRPGGKKKEVS